MKSAEQKLLLQQKKEEHAQIRKLCKTPRCVKGQIVREGHYTKKHTVVCPVCIEATGLSQQTGKKGEQLFILERGTLGKYGYKSTLSDSQRRRTLKRALQTLPALTVYRKLNAIALVNRNRNPTLSNLFKEDAEWVKTTNEYQQR